MSPRYMGGFGVIAKSMARIHETVSFHSSLIFTRGVLQDLTEIFYLVVRE